MSKNSLCKWIEMMFINLKIDKLMRELSFGILVSWESSFSSVELGVLNFVSCESSFFSVVSSSGSGGIFEVDLFWLLFRFNFWWLSEDFSER